ncbi:hypothetical protein KY338_01060 [Candidatus Woesearchaeota archaeon]|nr:hypothetical protein [Candidatus Woesearchaeota archaeon]MBW3006187.1 hypothetical protein [Candidatus Woesearchaeota archaeon]
MKNAQITVFMIIGIVILFGAGLLVYMAMIQPEKTGEEKVAAQALRQSAVRPVKDYITSCLEIVSSDALDFIGKQGGRLYKSQGGTIPDPGSAQLGTVYLDSDELKLSYSVLPPQGTVGDLFFSDPPDYPWPEFPVSADSNRSVIGFFGLASLPPLYRKHGRDSLQEQMESYISNNIGKCADFSDKFPGYEITAGEPSTSMIIAENITHLRSEEYISFVLDWPVEIKETGTSAEITLNEFRATFPIAFGRIYYTVKEIVDAEVSNISYEPEATVNYFITINKNVYNKDDVIIYQDKKYKLNARPYEFRIARKNRFPALYKIDQSEIDRFAYCVDAVSFSIEGNTLRASPDLEDDDPFPLNISVVDPDNDVITLKLDPRNPEVDEYAVALYADNPSKGGLIFKVIAFDGELEDYQRIRIIPKGCEVD